jgi:6-phosphogluconolactonase
VAFTDMHIVPDADALAAEAASMFKDTARQALLDRGVFRVALSGGSTPRALYRLLARQEGTPGAGDRSGEQIDWSRVELFFGDERHVPPDHVESNYRMVRESLLDHVPVSEGNVYRIHTEWEDADRAAADYEKTLRNVFGTGSRGLPRFDLVLFGMGPDGHTASLFPHTSVLHETERLAAAVWVEKFNTWRVTLTVPVLNNASTALVLVAGLDKAETLREVIEGPPDPDRLPIQRIALPDGHLRWLVDTMAASRLGSASASARGSAS